MSHRQPSRKRPPALPFRVRAAILPRGFLEMAPPAKGLQVLGIVGRPAPVQRDNVIALQPTGPPARSAAVAIAAEHEPAKLRPSAPVERRMEPGAASGHYPASPWYRRRGFGARESAPAASTSAAATSSRPVLCVPFFTSRTDP